MYSRTGSMDSYSSFPTYTGQVNSLICKEGMIIELIWLLWKLCELIYVKHLEKW